MVRRNDKKNLLKYLQYFPAELSSERSKINCISNFYLFLNEQRHQKHVWPKGKGMNVLINISYNECLAGKVCNIYRSMFLYFKISHWVGLCSELKLNILENFCCWILKKKLNKQLEAIFLCFSPLHFIFFWGSFFF